MRRLLTAVLAAVPALAFAPLTLAPAAQASPGVPGSTTAQAGHGHRTPYVPGVAHYSKRVCARVPAGAAACEAKVWTDAGGTPVANAAPAGYGPGDLQGAYGLASLASSAGSGKTVAIVDAYDDPTAAQDLATYRSTYGLPAVPSLRKVSQTGSATALPTVDAGWAQEISLDLDMVSAACPNCSILLVEATSASLADLATAVNYAKAQPGVVAVSNSYGGRESSSETTYAGSYSAGQAGQWITASSGDSGYGAQSPAVFNTVVAVGGTSLSRASGTTRGWAESAWSGAGSGCSAYIAATFNLSSPCGSKRAEADVSAVADPNTGVAVYDSTPSAGSSGWLVFGGTSASAPLIGAVHALAASSASSAASLYSGASVNDVTSGSNGRCRTALLAVCTAGPGWDGPTGVGTPNGSGGLRGF